jgi:hypothetical protein
MSHKKINTPEIDWLKGIATDFVCFDSYTDADGNEVKVSVHNSEFIDSFNDLPEFHIDGNGYTKEWKDQRKDW